MLNINLMLWTAQSEGRDFGDNYRTPGERWGPELWPMKQCLRCSIMEFSFVLKALWTLPWFMKQQLYQAVIWHPSHFHSTHRGKLILELKIITGLTSWKWKEMYPGWEKKMIGLTIFQLSREDQSIDFNKSARVPRKVSLPIQYPGPQSKDPRCLGALEEGFKNVWSYHNISKNI